MLQFFSNPLTPDAYVNNIKENQWLHNSDFLSMHSGLRNEQLLKTT